MNIEDLKFAENTYDIIVSIAVFEHIKNLQKAVSELHRVLKKGGFAYIVIHMYPSFSGNHYNLYRSINKIPPWDHLRSQKRPVPVYLNKGNRNDYIQIISEKFKIINIKLTAEDNIAEKLLTPELLGELSNYTKEELLTKAICVVCKKI
jgi:ubiquinone/menaquinone biosynthesis C-methylase UbiE